LSKGGGTKDNLHSKAMDKAIARVKKEVENRCCPPPMTDAEKQLLVLTT